MLAARDRLSLKDLALTVTAGLMFAGATAQYALADEEPTKPDTATQTVQTEPQEQAKSSDLAGGSFLPERTRLKERIEKLKAAGVGIKPYQDAFAAIEESVSAKEPDDQIHKSVERLNSALDQQMQSKAAISSNSYYHVHGSTTPGHNAPSGAPAGAPSGAGAMHLPAGLSPSSLTPEKIQQLLKDHPEFRQKYEDYKKNGHI